MASGKLWGLGSMPMPVANGGVEEKLDAFTADYMKAMNAPGMTQALTDSASTLRIASYGLSNIDLKLPVTTDQLFQIGSITKSFVALTVLQLREEGKLDLHRPVIEYLPWLPITMPFGPITIHHLLTHTSGLPDASGIFFANPEARHIQGFVPGAHFHYCNLGFDILGQVIEKLDGKPWRACVQARILTPMGMSSTAPVITLASSARSAVGYQPYFDDQVYPRQGRLGPRPPEIVDGPAGSIASPPADMARYLRMLLNSGQRPGGRIVSEQSFALLSTPYIKAAEFGANASYGYGIAVDVVDGHKTLLHTGGMSCFASSIHVDLDGGYAAFASINAMQGYRPTAVTKYAVQLLRTEKAKPLPAPEPLKDPTDVDDAHDYAGTYRSPDGRELVFKADGKKLLLIHGSEDVLLQRNAGDAFLSTRQDLFGEFGILFDRAKPMAGSPSLPQVVEVGYGPDWYVNESYHGDREFKTPAEFVPLIGRYRGGDGDDARVFVRKGQLWLGDSQLTQVGSYLFRIGEEAWSPDTVEFSTIADGRARVVRVIDDDCFRIEISS